MTKLSWGAVLAAAGAAGGWFYGQWQIEELPIRAPSPPAVSFDASGRAVVRHSGVRFAVSIARFRDELFAYLMLQHYREVPPAGIGQLMLVYREQDEAKYEILLGLSDDFVASTWTAAAIGQRSGGARMLALTNETARRYENQTRLFDSAYNLPVRRTMEELSREELRGLMRRFIRFKSTTDPRVRKRIEPEPRVLSSGEAEQLAGDVIAIAEFYDLPLEYLLGIGAMENNYMNVRGDLKHSIWKKRAAKDDVVLERRKGRVRVLNDSAGVWQITRETLRYAHRLYVKDERDYSRLPEHLRPPETLDVNEFHPEILTTYAGLLLRDLLDRFEGNVGLAVGAYNGGPGRPNARYESGVRRAAGYAREVMERAAVLNGESALERSWIRAR